MKKITSIILIICFALLTIHYSSPEIDTSKEINSPPILNLRSVSEFTVCLENASVESNNAQEYDICVLIELNDPLTNENSWLGSNNISPDTNDIDEALREHRKKVKEYYVTQNEAAASMLGLEEYNYYVSYYSPYIEIAFDDLAEYAYYESNIIESIENSSNIVLSANSYATIDKINTTATVDGTNYTTNYPISDAFDDIGVSNSAYTGSGVRVGILEANGVPYTDNLISGKYTLLTTTQNIHSTVVASIIGGSTGIAEDAHLYCMKLDSSLIDCINELIDTYEVNIINLSLGNINGFGYYVNVDSCIDKIISNSYCSIVIAAGNRSTDWSDGNGNTGTYDYKVTSPGTAINAITVGAINSSHNIRASSSWLVTDSFLLKPDVVAPGGRLSGIPNTGNNNPVHSGTSFAAPMVTGTIALLMEEFPELKTLPAWVKSIVHSGSEPLPSQTDYYDQKAGFGLINYEKMRECLLNSNYTNFAIPPNGAAGRTVCTRNVTIPYSHEIYISANSIIHSSNNVENTERATPQYTDYVIKIFDIGTSSCVATSTVDSSVDYLCFKNTNPSNTSFRIEVVLAEANVYPGAQMGAIAYEISPHAYSDDYTWLSDTQHCKSCDCGAYITGAHVVDPNGFPNPEGYATCLLCGGDVFMGVLNSLYVNTLPHTINGSYKLQNGVIVLVEEDMEAYLNGTLVFYTGEIQ